MEESFWIIDNFPARMCQSKGRHIISKYYQIGEIVMTTTLKQLIEKLQSLVKSGVDPKIPVILEHNIDRCDTMESYGVFNACKLFSDEGQDPITFRYAEAQESLSISDPYDIKYAYDCWKHLPKFNMNEKKVLVLSSPSYKYGTEESESL